MFWGGTIANPPKSETWCDRDEHNLFEYYVDFNEWLDSEDAAPLRPGHHGDGVSVAPHKTKRSEGKTGGGRLGRPQTTDAEEAVSDYYVL